MRIFSVRKGKYQGAHKIYDTLDEAIKDGVPEIFDPWYHHKVRAGDWVKADDGYVIQLLAKYKLKNKRHKSGQYTQVYRFCNGTFWVYFDKDGNPHPQNFYGAVANNNKSSLGNTPRLGRNLTIKKKEFLSYIEAGYDPYQAAKKAYRLQNRPLSSITRLINDLLDDNNVKKEMRRMASRFMDEVEKEIKEKTGMSLREFFVHQTTKLLTDSKLNSSKNFKQNLEFGVKLFGSDLGIIAPKPNRNSKGLPEADYEILPPPELTDGEPNGNTRSNLHTHSFIHKLNRYNILLSLPQRKEQSEDTI
jgi:hypothetical protein